MPETPVAVKTIVTTPMAAKVAEHYSVQLIDVLTGFKFIGEQIGLLEKEGQAQRYIFGFEESYGYLSGGFVRDKDAVNASLLICEMFAWYKAEGKSLLDVLDELYQIYGYYSNRLLSFAFEGAEGFSKMNALIEGLREEAPKELAGYSVTKLTDYLRDDTGLPKSNVLRFWLEGSAEVVIRPSGTEPKLKIYLTAAGQDKKSSQDTVGRLDSHFQAWVGK